jgi:two-component system, OmpR family, phosphate regulon sensor histidine kinase PhoR
MMKPPDGVRFVSETATRRVRDTGSPLRTSPVSDCDLYSRLRGWLARVARVDRADDLPSLLGAACDAMAELFDVAHFRLCRYVPARGFEAFADRKTGQHGCPGPSLMIDDTLLIELGDVMEWACHARRPVFFELSETNTGRISTPDLMDDDDDEPTGIRPDTRTIRIDNATANLARHHRASAIAVLPVIGENGPAGAVLAWMRDAGSSRQVLESELLNHLCALLSRRAASMAATLRMRELGNLFDNILESVPHGILAIGRDGRVMALNANAEFLFDIKRVFVLDEPYQEALPGRLASELQRLMGQLLLDPSVDSRLELELKPGTVMSIGISASFLQDRSAERQGYLFLCRDLSLSLEVQKLRELDRMKTEFVNTVSHELKTPLTAILGGIEILQGEQAIQQEYRELGDVIQTAAVQLRDLIFDLLNIAKLESGKARLRLEPVDVCDLVNAQVRMLPPHPMHDVKVQCDDLPPVMLDREKVGRAVLNYLSNAIKYSPDGGSVQVRAMGAGDDLELRVTDEGMGIAPENFERVWEKFFRVDAGFTAEIEGTGLGLVIVRRIVELHGGEVFVESMLGSGSTFGIRIPIRTAQDQETVP